MTLVAISIGAVLGANARFLVGLWAARRLGAVFPYGTMLINVSGCFLVGLIATWLIEGPGEAWWIPPGVIVGFLGSYTTFSTFSWESLILLRSGRSVAAAASIGGNVVGALVATSLGILLAA